MKELMGTWKLVSMEHRTTQGRIFYPYGKDAEGRLMYSMDGFMAVTVASANRKPFHSQGLFEGSDTEKKIAMETFLSYCGRYRVESNKIVHVIEMSLYPNWIGKEEPRYFELFNDLLVLRTASFTSNGEEQVGIITWQKA